ncbi:MAG: hypothetical protein ACREKS_02070 [Candidatus Rokuibacteriota bacterium]
MSVIPDVSSLGIFTAAVGKPRERSRRCDTLVRGRTPESRHNMARG